MPASPFFKTIFKFISAFTVLAMPAKLQAQSCDEDQASFRKISEQLQTARKGITKDEADLKYMKQLIDNSIDERNKVQSALEVVEKDSYKAKVMNLGIAEFNRKIAEYKKRETQIQQELNYYRREEPILLNSFHLVRDRLDKNCGGVKKEEPIKGITDVSGTYRSPYGKTIVTQGTGEKTTTLVAVVHYDTGGTSTLSGPFDGITWTYTWRNSFDHFGSGSMVYTPGEGFNGWWLDKSLTPFNKGNWWLHLK